MFLIQVMKAAAVILLLAVCGTAYAANMIPKQAECAVTDSSILAEVASRCTTGVTNAAACSNNPNSCASFTCNYYKNNNFPRSCRTSVGNVCRNAGIDAPSACGAAALSAIKGLLVAVLLLAALIVA